MFSARCYFRCCSEQRVVIFFEMHGTTKIEFYIINSPLVNVGFSRKQLKEPYTIDELRDVFMKIRASLDSRRSPWVQYVLPPENVLPDEFVATSSAADAAASVSDMTHEDDVLAQLMNETRAVVSR